MIELRRRYSGSKGSDSPSFSRLPAGYQEVEYLENTYDARLYFPVDFQTNDIISVETSFMITGRFSLYRDMCIIGVGGANKFALTISRNGNSFRYEIPNYPDRRYVDIYNDVAYDTEYSIKINTINGSYVNDNLITDEVVKGNDYYSGGVYIFNRGPLFEEPFLGRLKELVLKTNTNTFHFIPCYRISDRKPGMYDIVNDVFYTNAGAGEFSYGQDVHYNIPPEYQQVEYLDNSNNPYAYLIMEQIQKGFVGNIQAVVCLSQVIQQVAATPYRFAFGWYNGPQAVVKTDVFPMLWHNTTTSSIPVEIDVKYAIETKIMETSSNEYISDLYVDNKLASRSTKFNNENPLYILNSDGKTNSFMGKLYLFASDGTVNTYLIPCYRKKDDVAGMYDLVSGEFYTNAGTGKFDVGPLVI